MNAARASVNLFLLMLFLTAVMVLPIACHKEPSKVESNAGSQPNKAASNSKDQGDLKLRYQQRRNIRAGDDRHRVGSNQQAIEKIISDLNNRIAFPFDIYVSFEDCDGPDAFYERETHQVTICHQLIDDYYDLFSRRVKDKDKLDEAVKGATASTFFHELGHALIDVWQLPTTGKEEDAADQLSTLVLINRTEHGEQMALDGALSFKLYANLEKGALKIYWDEHSLDEQRFYDTICLIYGHDPEKYAYLIKDGELPEERAEMCTEDYPKIARAWQQLLEPYLKQSQSSLPK